MTIPEHRHFFSFNFHYLGILVINAQKCSPLSPEECLEILLPIRILSENLFSPVLPIKGSYFDAIYVSTKFYNKTYKKYPGRVIITDVAYLEAGVKRVSP